MEEEEGWLCGGETKKEKAARDLNRKILTTPAVFSLNTYGLLILFHWRIWDCSNDGIYARVALFLEKRCSVLICFKCSVNEVTATLNEG